MKNKKKNNNSIANFVVIREQQEQQQQQQEEEEEEQQHKPQQHLKLLAKLLIDKENSKWTFLISIFPASSVSFSLSSAPRLVAQLEA